MLVPKIVSGKQTETRIKSASKEASNRRIGNERIRQRDSIGEQMHGRRMHRGYDPDRHRPTISFPYQNFRLISFHSSDGPLKVYRSSPKFGCTIL